MLDSFLMVAFEAEKKASAREEMVEIMKKLPEEELHKIASGEVKMAGPFDCDGGWLDRYKDTPLFEQALQLEQMGLQIEAARLQKNIADDAARQQESPDLYQQESIIRLKKKMLDLQLAQQGAMPSAPAGAIEAPPAEVTAVKQAYGTAGIVGGLVGYGRGGEGNRLEGVARGAGGELGGAILGGAAGGLLGRAVAGDAGAGIGNFAGAVGGGILGSEYLTKDWGREKTRERSKGRSTEKEASARLDEALAKLAADKPKRTRVGNPEGHSDAIDEGLFRGVSPEHAHQLAQGVVDRDVADWQQRSDYSQAHPIRSRLNGAATGGVLGAVGGGALGAVAGSPGIGALVGGGLGALGGGLMASPSRFNARAEQVAADRDALLAAGIPSVMQNRARGLMIDDAEYMGQADRERVMNYLMHQQQQQKQAEANFDAALAKLAEKEKDAALGSAIMSGLRGAGQFARQAAGAGALAYKGSGGGMAGLKALGTLAKPMAGNAARAAGNFATANPAAAATIGAGALGTAGLAGAALG